jgi:putative transposase
VLGRLPWLAGSSVAEIEERGGEAAAGQAAEQDLEVTLARGLLERAERGVSVVSPEALLAGVTRTVSQAALDAEMTDHLGYEKGQRPAHAGMNHRNGTSAKIVLTEVSPIPLEVPRDRRGEFQPQIIPQARPPGRGVQRGHRVALCQGLTTGGIRAHLAGIYEAYSKQLSKKIYDSRIRRSGG